MNRFIKIQLFAEEDPAENKDAETINVSGVGDVIIELNRQIDELKKDNAIKDSQIAELSRALRTISIAPTETGQESDEDFDTKINKLFGE